MLRNLADDIVGTIVSSIGTMISIGLNLTPILLFYRYFKKTAPLETIPESMFITGIFCCATNLAYGILKGDKILIISNGVCYGLQILYGTTYIFIKNAKRIDKLLLYLIIAWDLSFEVLYIFADVLAFHTSNDFAQTFTGGFNIFIGTLNVITPGQNIIKVFKTGDFTLIPIVTIFFQCACSSLWFVYQITTFYYFYCKLHGIPPERKEDDEQSPEQQKDGTTEQIGNTNDKPDNEQKLMADD